MEKSINFFVENLGHTHEIIDATYAYYQSLDSHYRSDVQFTFANTVDQSATVNVYLDYMPQQPKDLAEFNLVLYSNGCEPLTVSTDVIANSIHDPKFYLVCNALVTPDHKYSDKIIWFPSNLLTTRDLWSRYFFPHYFSNYRLDAIHTREKNIIFLNGRNDSWRYHFSLGLQETCPQIPQHSKISTHVHETLDSFFESQHDRDFRESVNDIYKGVIQRNQKSDYYDNSIECGIDGRFGRWPPGYMILPLYYQYSCVIFPESTWQNDEVAITEKICKCFFSGALPWPVGGSNIHRLYNEIGFYTAWNLLPEDLQCFDSEKDHLVRYRSLLQAIKWLEDNPEILHSQQAQDMIVSNRQRFLTCAAGVNGVEKFDQILKEFLKI